MIIGTLSMERRKNEQVLTGRERVDVIAGVASEFHPDLLVCAGYSLYNKSDLRRLAADPRINKLKSVIILEVEESLPPSKRDEEMRHCMYFFIWGQPSR